MTNSPARWRPTPPAVPDNSPNAVPQACVCALDVEGNSRCGVDVCTHLPCTTNQACESEFGAGAFCQAPNTGCCGAGQSECLVACGHSCASGDSNSGA